MPLKQIRVGNIFIVGNKKTADSVIRGCLPFPGEPLDYPKIREAEKKLTALGLFSEGVEIAVIEEDKGNVRDIIVSVTEAEPKKTYASIRECLQRLEKKFAEVESPTMREAMRKEAQDIRTNMERLYADEVRGPGLPPPQPLNVPHKQE